MSLRVERVADDLAEVTRLPYTQCLATVKRRARQHGCKRTIPVILANNIIAAELRAIRAPSIPMTAMMMI